MEDKEVKRLFYLSQYLNDRAGEELGFMPFAFANHSCECGKIEGLTVFNRNTKEVLLRIGKEEKSSKEKLYDRAIKQFQASAVKCTASIPEIKTAYQIMQEQENVK